MTKKILSLLLSLLLGLTPVFATAEDADSEPQTEEANAEEMQELNNLDAVDDNDDGTEKVVGETYHEAELADFNNESTALYTAKTIKNLVLYAERSKDSTRIATTNTPVNIDLLSIGSMWAIARYDGKIGFIKRDKFANAKPLDPVNTPPYGVQKASYIATTLTTAHVRKSMSAQDANWAVLNPGTMLSIWKIQNGWAIVHYWRTYGYINLAELTDLIPVSPTDTPLSNDTPIAAYTSFYTMVQTAINKGRIINIDVACKRLTRVLQPGESLNFNADVGPYRRQLGYQPAWVLVDGKSVKGYGGGTCQVSSTLYNALKQLPQVEILQRRPHGPGGAKYLPHGVDAAVGNNNLNLRFQNHYPFPIRIEGHTSGDGALLMVIYRAD